MYGNYIVKINLKRRPDDANKNIKFWVRYDVIEDIKTIKLGTP